MEDKQQSVILRIGSDYYSLTPAEKRLADYILANQERVVRQSISELAQQSGVAEATISRFSRHMGYKSFPLLKLAVANAMAQARLGDTPLSGQVEQSDDLKTMSQKLYRADVEAMLQTMEVLDLSVVARVAGLFHEARQIMCMGQGGSMLIAREAAHLFSTVSNKFWPVEELGAFRGHRCHHGRGHAFENCFLHRNSPFLISQFPQTFPCGVMPSA